MQMTWQPLGHCSCIRGSPRCQSSVLFEHRREVTIGRNLLDSWNFNRENSIANISPPPDASAKELPHIVESQGETGTCTDDYRIGKCTNFDRGGSISCSSVSELSAL